MSVWVVAWVLCVGSIATIQISNAPQAHAAGCTANTADTGMAVTVDAACVSNEEDAVVYSTGAHVMTWAEYVAWMRQRWNYFIHHVPECMNQAQPPQLECPFVPPKPGEHVPGVEEIDVKTYVRQASTRLPIPEPRIVLGPDPAANEWNMAVVGLPLWLATPDTAARSISESSQGLSLRLSAQFKSVTFDLGDGTSVVCRSMPAYSHAHLGEASPSCGHTYVRPSTGGAYTVRATATWTVSWSAAGYSGTFPLVRSFQRQLKVGELQSLIKA